MEVLVVVPVLVVSERSCWTLNPLTAVDTWVTSRVNDPVTVSYIDVVDVS